MDQRLNFVTLAVANVERSRDFYTRLGWESELYEPGEVVFFRISPTLVLSLWSRAAFKAEVGQVSEAATAPFTLAHNVESPEEVIAVLREVEVAGGTIIDQGTEREWGGFSGYFADLDGFRFEVAYNPGPIGKSLLGQS